MSARSRIVSYAVSNEGPATISREAMPGDIDFSQWFGCHRFDGITPQSNDTADRPMVLTVTHGGPPQRRPCHEDQCRAWRMIPLQRLSTVGRRSVSSATARKLRAQQNTRARKGQAVRPTVCTTGGPGGRCSRRDRIRNASATVRQSLVIPNVSDASRRAVDDVPMLILCHGSTCVFRDLAAPKSWKWWRNR